MRRTHWLLIALLGLSALASATARDGAWVVAPVDESTSFASTFDADGQILAMFCGLDTGRCVWILGTRVPCHEGQSFVGSVESGGRARELSFHCGGRVANGLHQLKLADFTTMNAAVAAGGRIELRCALLKDPAAFDLAGAMPALQELRATMRQKPGQAAPDTGA